MKLTLAAVAVLTLCLVASAQAQQTFEQAWQSTWRPKISGSILSRRFEGQIKAACQEVWDVAQANAVAAPAVPVAAAKVQPAKVACECTADGRECVCSGGYPCGDAKCPWTRQVKAAKPKGHASAFAVTRPRKRPFRLLFHRMRRR